ncbi:bone morphogenetic protein receptor type-1A-like [Sycon ciliatum]|uniref:bone morphogenetic protein receptor type-1A-like n=1 Tax=Sycon ciliatum TaxID=27933 RepID=UPI0031F6920E
MLEAGLLGTGDVGNRMWTIFERCTHGNLRDLLLRSGCVQTQEMLRILHSIASGLHYLHSSSPPGTNSTGEFKPSIAHCHLATYNVFVRRDGSACIGNLCSSVPKSAHGTESQVGGVAKTTANYFIPVVGSPRYASPEMLSMWVDAYEDFDILLASDIYSFSLIMWEILVMCPVGQASNISPYCKVYSDVTGQKPSLRDMQYHVVELRGRPVLDPTWTENKHHRDITDLMRSCWHTNYRCRLTAGAVLARLEKLVEQLQRTTQHGGQGSNDGGEPSRHYENVDASALTFALGSQDAGEKPAYSSSSSLPSDCERYSQDPLAIAGGASSHLSSSSSASCSSHWPVVTRVDLSGGGGGRLPLVRECHIEGQDADGYCPMKSIPD